MEEETEILDWGAQEDENQTSRAQQQDRHTTSTYTDEDEDDAVSLGDEDDQGYYYQTQSAQKSTYETGITQQAPERSPSPPSREEDLGAYSQQRPASRQSSARDERAGLGRDGGAERGRGSPPRTRTSSSSTGHGHQRGSSNAANQSQAATAHNGTRLTHALPPKPVTVPSAYLSHSLSIVEAVGMASSPPGQGHARPAARDRDRDRDNRDRDRDRESHREQRDRDAPKKDSNGPSAKQRGSSPVDLPPNWETRVSRTNGDVYYYNRETYESTRVLPSSSSASAPGRQRRRHSRSPGPASSDAHHSQASRSARDRDSSHRDRGRTHHDRHDRARDARDREAAEGSTRSATPDLTHRDRYYRPEAAPESDMSVDVVRTEHTEIISARMSPRIRYEGSPSPPPLTRPSRRARSLSPLPAQDSARNSHARAAPARDRGRERDFEYNNRSSAAGPPARDRDTGRLAVRENRDRDRDRHKERNYTNSDSSMSRDRDLELEAADYSDRHWNAAPPADLPNQRQRGARRQDDALIDSRPSDNIQGRERDRNARPLLRHSESSRGLRDREPPRQADRRERGGELEREQREQQQYMPTQTQRYRSPPPPANRARDRDQGRDYQESEPIQPSPAPATRRDRERERDRDNRSSRFEPSSSSSSIARQGQGQVPPPPPPQTRDSVADAYAARERARDREQRVYEVQGAPPPGGYDTGRRDRDFDRDDRDRRLADRDRSSQLDRREPAFDDAAPRRPETYPPPSNLARSGPGPNERPPPRRYNDDRDREHYDQQQQQQLPPHPDEQPHRRRAPLPPQTKSFLTSSSSGPIHRDPPPHTSPAAEWKEPARDYPPRNPPPDDRLSAPRRGGRGEWPPPSPVPGPPPRIDTRMDVDYPDAPRSADHLRTSPYARPSRDSSGRPLPTPTRERESYDGPGGPRSARPSLPSRPSAGGAGASGPLPPLGPARRGPEGPPPRHDVDRRGQGQDGYGLPPQDGRRRDGRGAGPFPERNQGPRHDFRERQDNVRPPPRGPPPPVTGTNNVPIGPRRTPGGTPSAPSLPPPAQLEGLPVPAGLPPQPAFIGGVPTGPLPPLGMPFNPAARPPPSTLIDPSKARDLPHGKESYERPPFGVPMIPQGPPPRGGKPNTDTFTGRDLPPHVLDNNQQSLQVPPGPDRPGRRRDGRASRFSPIDQKARPEFLNQSQLIPERLPPQDPVPERLPLVQSTGQDDKIDVVERPPTPPPLSREPSALSVSMDLSSSHISELGQSSDGRSDTSPSGAPHLPGQQPVPSQQLAGPSQDNASPEMRPPATPVREQEPFSRQTQQSRSFTRWGDKSNAPPGVAEVTVLNVNAEPALSRRLSDGFGERPPRHRKHPSDKDIKLPGPGENILTTSRSADERAGFMDRLEAPPLSGDSQPSLLERLSAPGQDVPPSLRDRIVPSKRSHEDVTMDERGPSREGPYDGDDGNENKRAKRRNGRGGRRGGRRGAP